jgi:hypothetical protein
MSLGAFPYLLEYCRFMIPPGSWLVKSTFDSCVPAKGVYTLLTVRCETRSVGRVISLEQFRERREHNLNLLDNLLVSSLPFVISKERCSL